MNGLKLLSCLVLAAGMAAAAGDLPALAGRIAAGPAPETPAPYAPFELFGWLCPPDDILTPLRMREIADLGMTLVLPTQDDYHDVGANGRRMGLAVPFGLRCLVVDRRFDLLTPSTPEYDAKLRAIVNDYKSHPGFFGYYLGDEPDLPSFAGLAPIHRSLRALDPQHPAWNNLSGRAAFPSREAWLAHTRAYLDSTGAPILCADHYDFLTTGDRGQYVENVAGLAAVARERGIRFWAVIQLTSHGPFRVLRVGEVSWQAAMLLAYGADGLGYFTYWAPQPDPKLDWGTSIIDWYGHRTEWYGVVQDLDRRVRAVGDTLATKTWLATLHAGSTPAGGTALVPGAWLLGVEGRAALGFFVDSVATPYVLVANADSLASRPITLLTKQPVRACVVAGERPWGKRTCTTSVDERLSMDLSAGGFTLLRLDGVPVADLAGGIAPRVQMLPTSGDVVRFEVSQLGGAGVIEVIDARGRGLWHQSVGFGDASVTWHDTRSGPVANRLPCFVRVEGARGVRIQPIPRPIGG